MIKVLLIANEKTNTTGASLNQIEEYLKTEFNSIDHMKGFFEGYFFDSSNYKVMDLAHYEFDFNKCRGYLDNYYIKFITIKPEVV